MIPLFIQLWIAFEIKHFLADFILQGSYMLGKFKKGWEFFLPLVSHCAVHFAFTVAIIYAIAPGMEWLAYIEFLVHFFMDRIKASPAMLGRYHCLSKREMAEIQAAEGTPVHHAYKHFLRSNKLFWWSLGLDQMVHNLTYCWMVYMLCK
jgi:hypothetical protein